MEETEKKTEMKQPKSKRRLLIVILVLLFTLGFVGSAAAAGYYFLVYSKDPTVVWNKAVNHNKKADSLKLKFSYENVGELSSKDSDESSEVTILGSANFIQDRQKSIAKLEDGYFKSFSDDDEDETELKYQMLISEGKTYLQSEIVEEEPLISINDVKWVQFDSEKIRKGDYSKFSEFTKFTRVVSDYDVADLANFETFLKIDKQPELIEKSSASYTYEIDLNSDQTMEMFLKLSDEEFKRKYESSVKITKNGKITLKVDPKSGSYRSAKIEFPGIKYTLTLDDIDSSIDVSTKSSLMYDEISYPEKLDKDIAKEVDEAKTSMISADDYLYAVILPIGNLDAKYTVVFSIYEHSLQYNADMPAGVYEDLKESILAGKVLYRPFFKDLRGRNSSTTAPVLTQSVLCAFDQRKGEEFYLKLIEKLPEISQAATRIDTNTYINMVADGGLTLNVRDFSNCLSSKKYAKEESENYFKQSFEQVGLETGERAALTQFEIVLYQEEGIKYLEGSDREYVTFILSLYLLLEKDETATT